VDSSGDVQRLPSELVVPPPPRTVRSITSLWAPCRSASATTVRWSPLSTTRNTSTPALSAAACLPSRTRHRRIVRSRDPDTTNSPSFDRVQHRTCAPRTIQVIRHDMTCRAGFRSVQTAQPRTGPRKFRGSRSHNILHDIDTHRTASLDRRVKQKGSNGQGIGPDFY